MKWISTGDFDVAAAGKQARKEQNIKYNRLGGNEYA